MCSTGLKILGGSNDRLTVVAAAVDSIMIAAHARQHHVGINTNTRILTGYHKIGAIHHLSSQDQKLL